MGTRGGVVLADTAPFRLGTLHVDPPQLLLTLDDGRTISLPPRVMQVLSVLSAADGAVVSRVELNERCWEGRALSNDALERVVAQLRRAAAEADDAFWIEAIPRVGYRLTAATASGPPPLEPALPDASPPPTAPEGTGHRPGRRTVLAGGAIAASAAAVGLALTWRPERQAPPSPAPRPRPLRLAVLPFESIGGSGPGAVLAAGVGSEVRDRLARLAGLRVLAEAASRDAPSSAGADLVLRGLVQDAPGALRVAVELIDPREKTVLWSDARQGNPDELFQLQTKVAEAALVELAGRIGVEHMASPPSTRLSDGRAFRLVAEARQWLDTSRTARMASDEQTGLDAGDRAAALARQALAIDRDDVGALLVTAELVRNGWTRALAARPLTAHQRVQDSLVFIRRALGTDPNDPAALTALGDYYRRFAWRWRDAETLFRKALAINPSLAEARWSYAYLLGVTGRAVQGLAQASILLGLDPKSTYRRVALPRLLYLTGGRDRAMKDYDDLLATSPASVFLWNEMYLIALTENDSAGLRRLAARILAASRRNPAAAAMTKVAARAGAGAAALEGRPAALLAMVDADMAAYDRAPAASGATHTGRASVDYLYMYSVDYAWAGRHKQAFALLERALDARSLYWPATLPYGPASFPQTMRRTPEWEQTWMRQPERRGLVTMRREALNRGWMAGISDDGVAKQVAQARIDASLVEV